MVLCGGSIIHVVERGLSPWLAALWPLAAVDAERAVMPLLLEAASKGQTTAMFNVASFLLAGKALLEHVVCFIQSQVRAHAGLATPMRAILCRAEVARLCCWG